MSNPAHQTASRVTVRDYLNQAYVVEPSQVNAALEVYPDVLEDAIRFGSHAYYAGDKIATEEGWVENPDYDLDDEDDWEDD